MTGEVRLDGRQLAPGARWTSPTLSIRFVPDAWFGLTPYLEPGDAQASDDDLSPLVPTTRADGGLGLAAHPRGRALDLFERDGLAFVWRVGTAEDPVVLDASNASGAHSNSGSGPVVSSDGRVIAGQAGFDDEIVGALGSLSVDARACFLLRVVEGLAYKEISRSLDIPEGTAMGHVHRVRKALREQLGGEKGGGA